MIDLREHIGGVSVGYDARGLELSQFWDMEMSVAMRFVAPETKMFIECNFTFEPEEQVEAFMRRF